jgi:hypothetical protein
VAATDAGMASRGAGWPQRLTEEDTVIQHPAIAAALAEQRRTGLVAEAETARRITDAASHSSIPR